MCGIIGFYAPTSKVQADKLFAATKALIHRGPDGQKIWISSLENVGFGHARLSIIDLETGDQPLHNIDQTIHLVANGELYDFEKTREDLIKRGHKFLTKSDSEIALHLYKEFGLDFVNHLRGEFAILLWDEINKRFIAVRDRFGIKPLYYANINNQFYFASEAKALFKLGVPAELDEESVYQNTYLPGSLPNKSIFRHIHALPAAHIMIIDSSGVNIKQYWDFDYPIYEENEKITSNQDQEYIEEFRRLLDESVSLRLRADVPVACYLSGGLDSSAVIGIAAKISQKPVHAFTLSFDHASYDESTFAKETCEKIGATHTIIPVSATDIVDHFPNAVWHAETVAFNGHISAKYLLSEHVRNAGYKVVLTGEGSDEMLAGYAHFRQDLLVNQFKNKDPSVIEEKIMELKKNNQTSAGILLAAKRCHSEELTKYIGYTPAWMESFILVGDRIKQKFLSENALEKYATQDVFYELAKQVNAKTKLAGRHLVNQSAYLWSKSALQNYILSVLGDRAEMAHSVEGRVPFLDHKIAEFAMKLPIHLKIREMNEKYILKEATRDILTNTIYKRTKHPFLSAPIRAKSNKNFYEFIQSTLRSDTLKSISLFDSKKVVAVLDKMNSLPDEEQADYEIPLLTLASLCVIQKRVKNENTLQ